MIRVDRVDRGPIWDWVHRNLYCVGTYTSVLHIAPLVAVEFKYERLYIEQLLTRAVDPRFWIRIDELAVSAQLCVKAPFLCSHPDCVIMRVHLL